MPLSGKYANSEDPVQMPQHAAFELGQLCMLPVISMQNTIRLNTFIRKTRNCLMYMMRMDKYGHWSKKVSSSTRISSRKKLSALPYLCKTSYILMNSLRQIYQLLCQSTWLAPPLFLADLYLFLVLTAPSHLFLYPFLSPLLQS